MSDPSLYMIQLKLESGFDDIRVKSVYDDFINRLSILTRGHWSNGWRSDDGGCLTLFASSYLTAQELLKQLEGHNPGPRILAKEDEEALVGSALHQDDSILVLKLDNDFATRGFGGDLTWVRDWIDYRKRR